MTARRNRLPKLMVQVGDRPVGIQAEGAKAPPDCRRIVMRLRYGVKGGCTCGTTEYR
jgi:hypothetical protein